MNRYTTPFYHPVTWITGYLLIHFAIRMGFSQTLQVDDAEQIVHAQLLSLGYPFPQPPLYSWLSWLLFQIFGTGLLAVTLLKYLLIGGTFWFIWLSSGYLFQHTQTRWLALGAFLLMPSFAWHMHQGFTHTILLGFAIALSFHATLRLHHTSNPTNLFCLGSALAIGIMAKYSFLLFAILLFLSMLSIPSFRTLLTGKNILLISLPFLLITLPHFSWIAQHQEVFGAIDQKLQVTQENSIWNRLQSFGNFTTAAIAFVTPFLFFYLITHWKKLFSTSPQASPQLQLLNRFYLLLIIITITLALFMSMPHFKVRWFHPLMMLFPFWLLGRVEGTKPLNQTKFRWIVLPTALLTITIIVVRLVQLTIGPELGHHSRLNRPIMETISQLPSHLTSSAHLITRDGFLGAHLLSHYPNNWITVQSTNYRSFAFSPPDSCLLLWDNDSPTPPPSVDFSTAQGTYQTTISNRTYQLSYAAFTAKNCP